MEGDANSSPELIPLKLKFKNSEIKWQYKQAFLVSQLFIKVGGGGYSMGGACCRHYGQGGGRLWGGESSYWSVGTYSRKRGIHQSGGG